jgi:hypothetical protein
MTIKKRRFAKDPVGRTPLELGSFYEGVVGFTVATAHRSRQDAISLSLRLAAATGREPLPGPMRVTDRHEDYRTSVGRSSLATPLPNRVFTGLHRHRARPPSGERAQRRTPRSTYR